MNFMLIQHGELYQIPQAMVNNHEQFVTEENKMKGDIFKVASPL